MALGHQQDPDLLSMVGLGTSGGQPRADGSTMENGVHLRWQLGEGIGFPPHGFDIYRREQNLEAFITCGGVRSRDDGGVSWMPLEAGGLPLIDLTPSGKSSPAEGCGLTQAALLPGSQSLRIEFKEPVRHVRIMLDERTDPTPRAAGFRRSPTADVLVTRQEGHHTPQGHWLIALFADQIDWVVLDGEDMIVCEICYVLVLDGSEQGWTRLSLNAPHPIYLPITRAGWGSPHPHSPNDQAEAEARLPANLPPNQRRKYIEGFDRELHAIIFDLVGTNPQRLYQLGEKDLEHGVSMQWPGLSLLRLAALDPNIARILGLYWLDQPPDPNRYYDYRLVAHYGDTRFPGHLLQYSKLAPGTRYGTVLIHEGVTYASPNPIEVTQGEWDGSLLNALFISAAIPSAPLSIRLPRPTSVVGCYVFAQAKVTVRGLVNRTHGATETVLEGEQRVWLEDTRGFDALVIETKGDLTLFGIEQVPTTDRLGDVVYVSFHHRVGTPPPVEVPRLRSPRVVATRTGLADDQTLMESQSSVGLRWDRPETADDDPRPGAPIFYHVRRAERGNQEQPAPITRMRLLNETAPMLITESAGPVEGESGALRPHYTDRNLGDGWYSYQIRGIDLFGRLGEWSPPETVQVQDLLPPPPPQAVSARYLDPTDPWLDPSDQDWAEQSGPGLKVRWTWPGILRLQAPDVVPPAAEFRLYVTKRELNRLSGMVTQVTVQGDTSTLATDVTWNGDTDALIGESIRVGSQFFTVVGNGTGTDCTITVKNLAAPTLVPLSGPCALVFSRGRPYWIDYRQPIHWERRLSIEPAQEIATIAGQVTAVEDFVPDASTVMTRPGATRTVVTDQSLTDSEGVLVPGVLFCEGVVYPTYGHTLGNVLKIHIVPRESLAETAVSVVEPPVGATLVYYPGRRYEVYVTGFQLAVDPLKGLASAHVAVSCSDGKSYVPDNPVWAQPGRGGLGNRPGNEGALSQACQVLAVKRTPPLAPANVPVASEPIFARPPNYYGQAKYTLAWEPVSDAAGYAVYRCSGAALFDRDRKQRQDRKGYYATVEVFADDPGFATWLAEYDPALTASDLIDQPDAQLDAWRAWANRFYLTLNDGAIQDLANRPGNERAFSRVNQDPVERTTYTDTFDSRGQGVYFYRVRAIDTANNLGGWSATYPPVHLYDVTPPAMPALTAATGGERSVHLEWRANAERDLAAYWLWRSGSAEALKDVRRLPPTVTLAPGQDGVTETYSDQGLAGPATYYYRLAAVDTNGNVSEAGEVQAIRVADTSPPPAPEWTSTARTEDGTGADLAWSCGSPVEVTIERRETGNAYSIVRAANITPSGQDLVTGRYVYVFTDPNLDSSMPYSYQLTARATNGLTSQSDPTEV